MYSILGRGSFSFNYCLNSAWHGGDQFVALLRWYGSPGFFDSGLEYIYIYIYIYIVLSVNEYTPFEKYNFKQYLNEHKNHFQNVDKTKFNITSV